MMKFAILYLDTLDVEQYEEKERAAFQLDCNLATDAGQPFVKLARVEKCWKVMQTCYFGKAKT